MILLTITLITLLSVALVSCIYYTFFVPEEETVEYPKINDERFYVERSPIGEPLFLRGD